jgi:hypothetical protein
MRYVSLLSLGALLLLAGCADSKWGFLRNSTDNARISGEVPTTTQLVAYLNRNSQLIQSIQCDDLDMDVKHGIQQFGLRGRMFCEKPHNFRLLAEMLGNRQADIGSNQDEFWYWIAKGDPYLVHCSYKDLPNVRVPFPFQPEWVMEALGMAEFGPPESYQLKATGDKFELSKETIFQGQRVFKVIVFNRDPRRIHVSSHRLEDQKHNKICEAQILEAAQTSTGAMVPKKVVLDYPAERMQLRLKLFSDARDLVLNQQYNRELFARPTLKGVQNFDLARGPEGAGGIRPAGGLLR